MPPLNLDEVRKYAENMEFEAERFYRTRGRDHARRLDPPAADRARRDREPARETSPTSSSKPLLTPTARAKEDETARRMFLLQYVQPGLAGLMDGSVSTLAPLFAAAFATHNTWETFLVGMAASVGAGISMGFAEAASDDGSLTGRGAPWLRGTVCGVMTTIGGVGHTLPYLIPGFLDRHHCGGRRGRVGTRRDFLYPLSLHGHAVPVGGVPGGARRNAGVPRRHTDRQLVEFSMTFVLAHLSDPHLAPLRSPAPELVGKRATGLVNWRRKRTAIHRPEVLARIVADLKAQRLPTTSR